MLILSGRVDEDKYMVSVRCEKKNKRNILEKYSAWIFQQRTTEHYRSATCRLRGTLKMGILSVMLEDRSEFVIDVGIANKT